MVFVKGRFGRFGVQEDSTGFWTEESGSEDSSEQSREADFQATDSSVSSSVSSPAASANSSPEGRGREGQSGRRSFSERIEQTLSELPGSPRVLSRSEHCISRKNIDPDALKVMRRLIRHDFKAYLVGGAVRDLLLNKAPKDYDISTDASPETVRTLFRNSRIIGRRFRINHVYFRGNKILEVSTFRDSAESERSTRSRMITSDNTFGDPETDAVRRDLTINGMFYDLSTFSVIDYVGGIDDLRAKTIRIIGDPEVRIQEDPVRMIRAVRHAARTGFQIEERTYQAICRAKTLITLCSSARVFEEFMRELRGGHSLASFTLLDETGLLPYLIPVLCDSLEENREEVWARLETILTRIDRSAETGKEEMSSAVLLAALLVGNLPARYYAAAVDEPEQKELLDFWHSPRGTEGEQGDSAAVDGLAGVKLPRGSSPASPEAMRRRGSRGKISPLGRMISRFFEEVGVSRRERERMEILLIARRFLISAMGERIEDEIRGKPYFGEAMLLLRLTARAPLSKQRLEHWEKKLGGEHTGRRRRRRSRRRPRKKGN